MIRSSIPRCLLLAASCLASLAWAGNPPKSDQLNAYTGSLLYVGLFNGQDVNVYKVPSNVGPVQQIFDGVSNITGDLAVDQSQKFYATSGFVVEYPRGGLVPAVRYNFADQAQPPLVAGTAVGSDGTLYAALYGDFSVVEYKKSNVNKSSFNIPAPSGTTAWAVAVDSQNNLYIEYAAQAYPSPAHIEKCPPSSTQCTDLGITLSGQSNHLALDSQGNLIACDQLAAQVDVFPPNSNQPRVISQGLVGCPNFALNATQDTLYVANQPHSGNNQGVSIFNYATGSLTGTITTGIPSDDIIVGIALSPAAQ